MPITHKATTARYAGDQGKIRLGLAVTDKSNSNLQWPDAMGLLGTASGGVKARRCFVSGWLDNTAAVAQWADWAQTNKVFPIISVKVPGNNWAGVAGGAYDTDLSVFKTFAKTRATLGHWPFALTVHHEPDGDGDLAVWGKMQTYLSNYFADVNGNMPFATIGNGWWHGPKNLQQSKIDAAYPVALTNAIIKNKGLFLTDCYDSPDPSKLSYTTMDRTSLKIGAFVKFARSRGIKACGLGEFGCHDDIDILKCWDVMVANKDIFAIGCYFNSGQNSRADWRMIPKGYPSDPAVNSYVDSGGSAMSQGRLDAGKAIFTKASAQA